MSKVQKIKRVIKLIPRAFTTLPKLKFYFGWHYKHSKVNEHQMLFESFHGKNISDSPLYVLKELMAQGRADDYTIYFATNAKGKAEHEELVRSLGLPVRLVDVESRDYPRVLATSKYLINNSSFPAYFMRRPEQRYVQTWHGTPLKTLGKYMRLGIESMYNVQHNFVQANVLTYPNEFTRRVMMRDYNIERLFTGKVAMVGYPRNSVFLNPDADGAALRERYGLDGFENFAYMPTWRGTSNHDVSVGAYKREVERIFSQLDAALLPHQRIYVNFHSMVAAQIDLGSYEHILPFPKDVDNYRFLNQMDGLITDYSSVFFDFSLTRKPIILFLYDIDEYLHDRGMYFDIEELPFQRVYTTDELAASLVGGGFRGFDYRGSSYEQDYLCYDTPDNARRVLDHVFHDPEPGEGIIDYAKNLETPRAVLDPRSVKTTSMIDAVAHQAERDDAIAIFPRTGFTSELSAHLHDHHRDDFDFMFITRTTPRTFAEELVKHVSKKTRAELAKRERQRVFGNLPTLPAKRDVYTGLVGDAVSVGTHKRFETQVVREGAGFGIDLGNLPSSVTPQRIVLVRVDDAGRETVVWGRALSAEETAGRKVAESFRDCLESIAGLGINYRCGVCIEVRDGQGTLLPYYPVVPSAEVPGPCCAPCSFPVHEFVVDEHDHDSFLKKCNGRDPLVVPFLRDESREVMVLFSDELRYAAGFYWAPLRSLACGSDGRVRMKAILPAGPYEVIGATLMLRGTDRAYDIDWRIEQRGDQRVLHLGFDASAHELAEIYWDPRIRIRMFGLESLIPIALTRADSARFMMTNTQALPDRDHVLFPYSTKGRRLAFVYRARSRYDTMAIRVKEATAVAAYLLLRPYWRHKHIWLVFEKFCSLAQDNGYYFFKYCMEELPEAERKRIFYVMDKSAPDYAKVKRFGGNVVPFMGLRHMLYVMAADLYVGSDSRTHLYQWRHKPSIVANRISKHDIFFLQHGVTAMKRVAYLFGKDGSSPMTYFTTTSKREQQIVVDHFGYTEMTAPICGFARWDALEDTSDATHPLILVMPTWRQWLEEQSAEVFRMSEYYQRYAELLGDQRLLDLLERYNARLVFYIHPKLSEQLSNFSAAGERVELVPMGTRPLNEIMMECSALVTDYSSVCWDVLYMDKPVAYYQFDQERYETEIGSYVDLNHDLPGDVCKTEDELLEALEGIATRGFTLTDEQAALAGEWFDQKDRKNCERTYRFLKGR